MLKRTTMQTSLVLPELPHARTVAFGVSGRPLFSLRRVHNHAQNQHLVCFARGALQGSRHVTNCVANAEAPSQAPFYQTQGHKIVLVGDVGGTNCRLNVWEAIDGEHELLAEEVYPTTAFKQFDAAVTEFLKRLPDHHVPGFASIAVAGPVTNQTCSMTNCPWFIDGPALTRKFGFTFAILNDFEAVGYAITALDETQYENLNVGASEVPKGPKVAIGPGTGLGVAQVVWGEGQDSYRVLPSEGAHGTFGPRSPLQRRLQHWVEQREGFCETEQVACGQGLLRIHHFLCEEAGHKSPHTKPAEVTAAAQRGEAVAQQAVELFLEIVGAKAGECALTLLATGGVYLCGGITPKVMDFVKQGYVLKGFLYEQNPKFSQLLRSYPLYAVKSDDIGLLGCRAYAEQHLKSSV